MKKQGLTQREMETYFYRYSFRSFLLFTISLLLFGLSIGIINTTSFSILGFTILLIAIGCIVLAIIFLIKSFYWNKRSQEEPLWLKEANKQWEKANRRHE